MKYQVGISYLLTALSPIFGYKEQQYYIVNFFNGLNIVKQTVQEFNTGLLPKYSCKKNYQCVTDIIMFTLQKGHTKQQDRSHNQLKRDTRDMNFVVDGSVLILLCFLCFF